MKLVSIVLMAIAVAVIVSHVSGVMVTSDYNGTIDFYAYGDSITGSTLNKDCYVEQMADMFYPDAIASRNHDGSGRTTDWAVQNLQAHYKSGTRYFFYMFTNDGWRDETGNFAKTDFPINKTVDNYMAIYNYVKANGTTPIPLLPIITPRFNGVYYNVSLQQDRIRALEAEFDRRGIFYVKMYDALDSSPGNGIPDCYNGYDQFFFDDGVHPNVIGNRIMAEYLWIQISQRFPDLASIEEKRDTFYRQCIEILSVIIIIVICLGYCWMRVFRNNK
jgi:lysophospholipase L1-like esterase